LQDNIICYDQIFATLGAGKWYDQSLVLSKMAERSENQEAELHTKRSQVKFLAQ